LKIETPFISAQFFTFAVWFASGALGFAGSIVSSGPNGEEAVKLRGEFLAQAVPISYEPHVKQADQFHISWIELTGRTQAFAERHSATDLIYAFWPWFDDPQHAPEATVLLLGFTHREMMRPQRLSYVDRANPGNWARLASGYMDECKIACRGALNQPEWWYPHRVLFDRDTVLTESKTSGVVRTAYVSAMQKALSDPQIRLENPLEVDSILNILCTLDAKDVGETFVDYAFYDWHTGQDFRRSHGDTNDFRDVYRVTLPLVTYIPRLGRGGLPLVLTRLARASEEERLIGVGGGAAPVLAVLYFVQLGFTEGEAVEAIEGFKIQHRELTQSQAKSLDEVVGAIVERKFRPDWLSRSGRLSARTWAVPLATNAVPLRRR